MDFFINKRLALLVFVLLCMCACKKEKIRFVHSEIKSPTEEQLSDITFFSSQIGFACGGSQFLKSVLIKTTDGGQSWQSISLDNTAPQKQLYALAINATGILHVAGFDGVTYYSQDTGKTFTYQQAPTYTHWQSCYFRTQDEAFLCGSRGLGSGRVLPVSSVNNWLYPFVQPTHKIALEDVVFADSSTGYIAGFGGILKTTDGGQNWEYTNAKNDYFTATSWINRDQGIAIGWEGTILKTNNGGEVWEKLRNGNNFLIPRLRLTCIAKNLNNELIIGGENGCLLHSNDNGQSWNQIEAFTDITFEQITFRDENTFFAVGDEGRIFKVDLP